MPCKNIKYAENNLQLLFDIYPDFNIKPHSLFGNLYRYLEDFLLEFIHKEFDQMKTDPNQMKVILKDISKKLDHFYPTNRQRIKNSNT